MVAAALRMTPTDAKHTEKERFEKELWETLPLPERVTVQHGKRREEKRPCGSPLLIVPSAKTILESQPKQEGQNPINSLGLISILLSREMFTMVFGFLNSLSLQSCPDLALSHSGLAGNPDHLLSRSEASQELRGAADSGEEGGQMSARPQEATTRPSHGVRSHPAVAPKMPPKRYSHPGKAELWVQPRMG